MSATVSEPRGCLHIDPTGADRECECPDAVELEEWKALQARITGAIAYVHEATCFRGDRTSAPCITCPSPRATAAALAVLDEKPRDARSARRVLHDAVCGSSICTVDSDHADRTQAKTASALRKFRSAE